MNQLSKPEEILDAYNFALHSTPRHWEKMPARKKLDADFVQQTKQWCRQVCQEVIGVDEPLKSFDVDDVNRNELRAQQRAKLNELLEKK